VQDAVDAVPHPVTLSGSSVTLFSSSMRFLRHIALLLSFCGLSIASLTLPALAAQTDEKPAPAAGHSYHGEIFNEGPRQAAVVIDGMGNVQFPSSAKDESTRTLVNQGVAALHGFWYLEAERFFRQAAKQEPDLAIAYWGMAEANTNNLTRARGFIEEAVKRRESASLREQLQIDALSQFLKPSEGEENDEARKQRWRTYFKNLEKIIYEFPADHEAKAWLVLQLWKGAGSGHPITSHVATDALLEQVFTANPLHPAHHYRIHLWDGERPESALRSSALCGPSLPAIAHMWHMPGHIYSRLNRYADAVWQQEASARVDHAHMIRTRLMPDQIHNFAHNNEWLTRNLLFLGRVQDALRQSRNLIAMPMHPRFNSLDHRGSFLYGRERLLETLTQYQLWDMLIAEAETPFFAETSQPRFQEERLAWLAVAHRLGGNELAARRTSRELRRRQLDAQVQQLDLEQQLDALIAAAASPPNPEPNSPTPTPTPSSETPPTKEQLERQIADLKETAQRAEEWTELTLAADAVATKNVDALEKHLQASPGIDESLRISWVLAAGGIDKAIEQAQGLVQRQPQQVRPLAILVHALWLKGDQAQAQEKFTLLRSVAGIADLETPLLARLQEVATAAGIQGDWRTPPAPSSDLGERPSLETLGPAQWTPTPAPGFTVQAASDETMTDERYQGKPRLIVFYLGAGCLHCVEQLTAIAPKKEAFAQLGVEILGISTEDVAALRTGIERFEQELPFPLLANPDHTAFKAYRCWDDFEDQPLHGTFLVDSAGRMRWHDIGHEPFTNIDFLLDETRRLLAIPGGDVP